MNKKNVRDSCKAAKICAPNKKAKRLRPTDSGNSLWQKLEPTLPLPTKRMKFKSPYKSPRIQLSAEAPRKETGSSTTGVSKDVSRTSTVKIKPIDPFKFCEPLSRKNTKDGSTGRPKSTFRKSFNAQDKVNHEVLALIQKTAETIKMIRRENEEWKRINKEMTEC